MDTALIQNGDIPFQGRPQSLEPVTWINDWPIIGVDEDNDGIGEPVKRFKKPIKGYPVAAPRSDDDFASSKFDFSNFRFCKARLDNVSSAFAI